MAYQQTLEMRTRGRGTAEITDEVARIVRASGVATGVVTGTSVSVPVGHGALLLGTWQGIYLWEHRTGPQSRTVVVTVLG